MNYGTQKRLAGSGCNCGRGRHRRVHHGDAGAGADEQRKRGMAQKLTVLNVRRNGVYELAVKTDKGILMVPEAAKLLKMHAPATMDDLLQHEDGPA